MLAAVDKELQPKLQRYENKFRVQAAAAAKRKISKVDLTEIARLRQLVLGLQKLGDGFTHEVITEKADPAMAKLRAAFILDRKEVLDKSKDLQADRKKLEDLGKLRDRCQIQMPTKGTDEEKPATASFDSDLEDEENLAASMAVPLDPRTRAVLAMNTRLAEKIDPEEARAILELNLTRNLLGLPGLAIDLNLCAARGATPPTWRSSISSPTNRRWRERRRFPTGPGSPARRPARKTSSWVRPAARAPTTVGSTVRGTIATRWATTHAWASAAAASTSRRYSGGEVAWRPTLAPATHGSGG